MTADSAVQAITAIVAQTLAVSWGDQGGDLFAAMLRHAIQTQASSLNVMKRLWDISPPVSAASPVFPGDTPYRQQWTWTLTDSCPVNVSEIAMSPHIGAHADAPLHYQNGASAIGALALEPFLGRCRVIHALNCGPLIMPRHLAHAVADLPPRVLVRSARCAGLDKWTDDFTAYAPQTIEWLAGLGVMLIGLDTPSIDPAASKTLDSHQTILRHDMRVLENLLLDAVPPGDYELIALPLALVQADASPVRAVLRELGPVDTTQGDRVDTETH